MALRARLIPTPLPAEQEWPHHTAEWKSLPAHLLWRGARRMEGETYLAEGYQVRLGLEARAAGWKRLGQIANVWQPNRLKGIQVAESEGTPFLAATQVYSIRPIYRKWLAVAKTPGSSERFLEAGTILVTCSGTVGRAITAPAALAGTLITHDLLRVVPVDQDLSGWIYAFFHSPQAKLMMTSSHYGQMIKHLETAHLEALPVPIVTRAIAVDFSERCKKILDLRNEGHTKTLEAERLFSEALGTLEITDNGEAGFSAPASSVSNGRRRFEGAFLSPAASKVRELLTSSRFELSSLFDAGYQAWLTDRFKRIAAEDGIPLVESGAMFETNPDLNKKIADVKFNDPMKGRAENNWLLMSRSGQVYGILGSVALATKFHENKIVSDDLLRISPRVPKPACRAGYLLVALSHPVFGRPLVKSLAYGSSIPHIDPIDLARFPLVRLDRDIENKIADLAEAAAAARGEADELERQMASDAGKLLDRFMAGDVQDFVVTMPTTMDSSSTARRFNEHECVRLAVARREAGLRKGAEGTVVHVYPDHKGYEVEFLDKKDGMQVLTLTPSDLKPLEA